MDHFKHTHQPAEQTPIPEHVPYAAIHSYHPTDTVEEVHAELLSLAGELDRRIVRLSAGQQVGGPLLVVIPNSSPMLDRLGDYWACTRSPGSPYRSPAINALNRILYTGRAAKMYITAAEPPDLGGRAHESGAFGAGQ